MNETETTNNVGQITSAVILRTLALKSKLGWGDNKHLTVADVIHAGRAVDLIWAYYNLSMISFKEDVLTLIGLTKDEYISKPGKNIDLGDEVIKRFETTELETQLKLDKTKFIGRFDRGRTRANQKLNTQIKNARTTGAGA